MIWMIYVDDHAPAHVHVRTQNGVIRLYLDSEASIARVDKSVKTSDIKKARRITAQYLDKLLQAWNEVHPED